MPHHYRVSFPRAPRRDLNFVGQFSACRQQLRVRVLLVLSMLTFSAAFAGEPVAGQAMANGAATSGVMSPPPLATEFVYEALVTITAAVEVGPTPQGRRRYIPIAGGTFAGPRIRGEVLPGGADWQLERTDGVTDVDALYSIRTDDGAVIIIRNQGVIARGGAYMRTALRFTAPDGPYAWLNESQFVGSITGGPRPGTVVIRVFRLL